MFCQSCGKEITVELKYCNRCGANLTLTNASLPVSYVAPVKLTGPTVVLGLTIVIGLGIVFGGATELAQLHVHAAFITWMVLFSTLLLFGSVAMLLRFWSKTLNLQRENSVVQATPRPVPPTFMPQQLPPRYEPATSVTENTTRTFSPIYRDPSEPT